MNSIPDVETDNQNLCATQRSPSHLLQPIRYHFHRQGHGATNKKRVIIYHGEKYFLTRQKIKVL
jgi:hypothetical protein